MSNDTRSERWQGLVEEFKKKDEGKDYTFKPDTIRYEMVHDGGWGYYVELTDPRADDGGIQIRMAAPHDVYGWYTEEDARRAAVIALRDLADRIERGEE